MVPPNRIELVTAVVLLVTRLKVIGFPLAGFLFILVLVIRFSTLFPRVRQHQITLAGYDAEAERKLTATNRIRTAACTFRSVVLLWIMARMMS